MRIIPGCRGSATNLATVAEALAGNARTGQGSVFLAEACAWPIEPIRLHAYDFAGKPITTVQIGRYPFSILLLYLTVPFAAVPGWSRMLTTN